MYAQLIIDVGPKAVRETAKMMGIETKLDALPAEGLGGLRLGVSPLEMANAYATLASGGIRNEAKGIQKVEFPDGKTDDLGKPKRKRVFTDGQAYEVTKILKQNVTGGTGTRAQIGCPAAGKTGTTDAFNDAWFVGYTPKLSTSSWVGYPNALQSMPGVAGGTIPAGIWHDYMINAKGDACDDFKVPAGAGEVLTVLRQVLQHRAQRERLLQQQRHHAAPNNGRHRRDNSAGGENYQGGYDPRLYEAPPQQAPKPTPAPSPRPPRRRPEHGNRNGQGNGHTAPATTRVVRLSSARDHAPRRPARSPSGRCGTPRRSPWPPRPPAPRPSPWPARRRGCRSRSAPRT